MGLDRRQLLQMSGGALAAAAAVPAHAQVAPEVAAPPHAPQPPVDWSRVRSQFVLAPDRVDMSAMLIASHPREVRNAIERHRRALDEQPIEYLEQNNRRLQNAARQAVGRYMGLPAGDVALTDSTTMGAGLVYNGLLLRPGQEVLTTHQDYYVTHEALRLAAMRTGAKVRRISLYDRLETVTPDSLAANVVGQIGPSTRVLALTWVLSSTGLKVPVAQISQRVRAINATRPADQQVLVCVDGVHGFANQDVGFQELGADFFFAGCHKWLFGPRGTGVVLGSPAGWSAMAPTIPTFLDSSAYSNWISGAEPQECTGARLTPGGFKAFEHIWALSDAFVLHEWAGRKAVADRTAELADQLKTGLAAMPHVTLWTPRSRELSAGIVSFDVAGMSANQAVAKLREWKILASVAPYARPHVRLTPSIRNSPQEVDFALQAVRAMA
ncbi:aminotransferase class V-fold PLP-dependent enzyme [Phenylobacterium sp. J367]|uniref:aminotransferase class V-fold PLP-dependent enzyme n=1 Tax=Phenylobacterium sp. J367 TaxID=2898435 RepID=UPI002150E261|nr:aminotransferase class V-fold PLP-dependent enzyme [Phenylobacterium sp. J367]MCR5879233.1 aminotransferase class V-fold PLP-dependent enzyme [Phenylobacterium sp. J367]